MTDGIRVASLAAATLIAMSSSAITQQPPTAPSPPPQGVYNIPSGFDFPADNTALEQTRAAGDTKSQRTHVWNVFAGMTQPVPGKNYPIFESWYAEEEAFQQGPIPQGKGPHRFLRQFRPPRQFGGMPGRPLPQAAGTAILSEVLFDYPNYWHIRNEKLYLPATLEAIQQAGAPPDPHIAGDTTVPPGPREAISLKTVWWPIDPHKVTPLPVWDPDVDGKDPTGEYEYTTWKRVVAVDPTHTSISPTAMSSVTFRGKKYPNAHLVSLKDKFYYVVVDALTAKNAMANSRLKSFVNDAIGRDLKEGDYVALTGTHMTTREIDDWVWATFWWHDRPNDGLYAADRTANVTGVWRNYLMNVSFDENLPKEKDGTPHIAFNPWLEAHFPSGVVSNCMNCHHRASFDPSAANPVPDFLPIHRGSPDVANDPAYAKKMVRTDFLWSIPFNDSP